MGVTGRPSGGESASLVVQLDEHHDPVGPVVHCVTEKDGEWIGLLGFGSAAFSLGPWECFVGWSEELEAHRRRLVLHNQRFCILPGRRRPNLASAVHSCTLSRLSGDAVKTYGDPVLPDVTFTNPARHQGACYEAASFSLRRGDLWLRS